MRAAIRDAERRDAAAAPMLSCRDELPPRPMPLSEAAMPSDAAEKYAAERLSSLRAPLFHAAAEPEPSDAELPPHALSAA